MIRLPFWKVESIGNDFPLFHLDDLQHATEFLAAELRDPVLVSSSGPPQATAECSIDLVDAPALEQNVRLEGILKQLAIDASDRKFGIGGDGILVLGLEDGDVRLRMFNPDGSEDFCGNGLRCAAWHAYRQGWVQERFIIRHLEERVEAEIFGGGNVRTVIDPADYTPEHVPVRSPDGGEVFDTAVWDSGGQHFNGSSLTTGSTHTVIWDPPPTEEQFKTISPQIEVDARFPMRTSVIWAREESPMRLKVRIWERAVGETLGCGTGSSAAAADYLRRQGRGGTVEVVNPGGTVKVSMERWNAPITIEGVAVEVYGGEYLFRSVG